MRETTAACTNARASAKNAPARAQNVAHQR